MWLDELYIQRLQRIEMTEPWSAAGPGLLAGAITLVFERDAIMCSSPLRYSHCQQGTVTAMFDGQARDLGFRFTVLPSDDAKDLPRDWTLNTQSISAEAWLGPHTSTSAAPPWLLQAEVEVGSEAAAVRLHVFGAGWLQLRYRPDLDGCIEFAPANCHRPAPSHVEVATPNDAFGWLHPASTHPFVLDNRHWKTAHPRDWPWPLARAWRSQPTSCEYRQVMKAALLARFSQHDKLRRRLKAMQCPVTVAGVPEGLIEEVAALV